MDTKRRYQHISRGERAFMPLIRMRRIRHEEDVARSQARRAGRTPDLMHFDCHCGSIDCLGNPIDKGVLVPYVPGGK